MNDESELRQFSDEDAGAAVQSERDEFGGVWCKAKRPLTVPPVRNRVSNDRVNYVKRATPSISAVPPMESGKLTRHFP